MNAVWLGSGARLRVQPVTLVLAGPEAALVVQVELCVPTPVQVVVVVVVVPLVVVVQVLADP